MNILFPCLGGRTPFILMIGVVTIESFAPSKVTTHPHGSIACMHKRHKPVFHSRTPRGFSTVSHIQGSQFSAYPSSPSSLAVSAMPGAAASLRSSLHGSNSFVLSALLVVSSCGIAMEQRTTFGKALSVSCFSIAEFFNPSPMRVNIISIILILGSTCDDVNKFMHGKCWHHSIQLDGL